MTYSIISNDVEDLSHPTEKFKLPAYAEEKPMSSKITRRKFVLAASSLGYAISADGLGVLPLAAAGSSAAFPLSSAALQSGNAAAPAKAKVLVFDVNQTMLDLNVLRPHFVRAFGDARRSTSGSRSCCTIPWW